jgi:hypothetical protein
MTLQMSSPGITMTPFKEGTLTADGTEQLVAELDAIGSLEGWIDLANMASGDSVTIKVYVKMKSGGTYRLYDSSNYVGAQANPALHTIELPTIYGIKITLQQTTGSYKTYDYTFFKRG